MQRPHAGVGDPVRTRCIPVNEHGIGIVFEIQQRPEALAHQFRILSGQLLAEKRAHGLCNARLVGRTAHHAEGDGDRQRFADHRWRLLAEMLRGTGKAVNFKPRQ